MQEHAPLEFIVVSNQTQCPIIKESLEVYRDGVKVDAEQQVKLSVLFHNGTKNIYKAHALDFSTQSTLSLKMKFQTYNFTSELLDVG